MKRLLTLMIILPFGIAAMEPESEGQKVGEWYEKLETIDNNFINQRPVTLEQVTDFLSIEIPSKHCEKALIDFTVNHFQQAYLQGAEEGQVDETILAALYFIKKAHQKTQDPAIRGKEARRHYKEMRGKFPDVLIEDDQDESASFTHKILDNLFSLRGGSIALAALISYVIYRTTNHKEEPKQV